MDLHDKNVPNSNLLDLSKNERIKKIKPLLTWSLIIELKVQFNFRNMNVLIIQLFKDGWAESYLSSDSCRTFSFAFMIQSSNLADSRTHHKD